MRWVCPYCENETAIKSSMLGQNLQCRKCNGISLVRDADRQRDLDLILLRVEHTAAVSWFGRGFPIVITILVGLVATFFSFVSTVLGFASAIAFFFFILFGIAFISIWSIAVTVCDELLRVRRLLEELVKKS